MHRLQFSLAEQQLIATLRKLTDTQQQLVHDTVLDLARSSEAAPLQAFASDNVVALRAS